MKTHHRDVLVTRPRHKYIVTVDPPDKMDMIARGDTVRWTITNRSGKLMTVAIGNFVPAPPWDEHNECRDKTPFERRISLRVRLKDGATGRVGGRIRADAHFPRTYKYDILSGRTILLDPEIEIEK